jgi:3-hydroxybutyryl-CoA dehydrogenase
MVEPVALPIIGVVGAGAMGAGIAQVALAGGHEVVLHDVDAGAIDHARERIRDGLLRDEARREASGSGSDRVDLRLEALRAAHTLDTVAGQAQIVVEAALEDLELKRSIFRALDAEAPPDTILATNTSALSIGAIAAVTAAPGRVLGLHFFNPVPRMALVEVVAGPATLETVVERATSLVASWGKTPVRAGDHPGFIVNRVNRPFTIRALRALEAGVASVEAIDAAVREAGFPMGPFELMDLSGLDVNLAAARAIWDGLGRPDRLRPSPIQEALVEAGRLGRKTGAGFYAYRDGRGAEALPTGGATTVDRPVSEDPDAIVAAILRAIDEEARRARDDGVATAEAIDLALRLGANHPEGPFERMARTGLTRD